MPEQSDTTAIPTSTIYVQAPNGEQGTFAVEHETVSVGKHEANNIRLNHPDVLDFHLEITFTDDSAHVSVQNSSRATFIDTTAHTKLQIFSTAEWHPKKRLYIGPFELWYDTASTSLPDLCVRVSHNGEYITDVPLNPLRRNRITIGSDHTNDIVIDSLRVAPQHLRISFPTDDVLIDHVDDSVGTKTFLRREELKRTLPERWPLNQIIQIGPQHESIELTLIQAPSDPHPLISVIETRPNRWRIREGGKQYGRYSIRNLSRNAQNLRLYFDGIDPSWLRFRTSDGQIIDTDDFIPLGSGSEEEIEVEMSVPSALASNQAEVPFKVFAQNEDETIRSAPRSGLLTVQSGVEIKAQQENEWSLAAGQTQVTRYMIYNRTGRADEFRLILQGDADRWGTSSPPILIAPDESAEAVITFAIPDSAPVRAARYPYTVAASAIQSRSRSRLLRESIHVPGYEPRNTRFTARLEPTTAEIDENVDLVIENLGNVEQTFDLRWTDHSGKMILSSRADTMTIPRDGTGRRTFSATHEADWPNASEQSLPYDVTVTSNFGQSEIETGQFIAKRDRDGCLDELLMAILALLALGTLLYFLSRWGTLDILPERFTRPSLPGLIDVTPAPLPVPTIEAGESRIIEPNLPDATAGNDSVDIEGNNTASDIASDTESDTESDTANSNVEDQGEPVLTNEFTSEIGSPDLIPIEDTSLWNRVLYPFRSPQPETGEPDAPEQPAVAPTLETPATSSIDPVDAAATQHAIAYATAAMEMTMTPAPTATPWIISGGDQPMPQSAAGSSSAAALPASTGSSGGSTDNTNVYIPVAGQSTNPYEQPAYYSPNESYSGYAWQNDYSYESHYGNYRPLDPKFPYEFCYPSIHYDAPYYGPNHYPVCEPDSDGDGLLDSHEIYLGTDPYQVDTDNDSIHDGFELCRWLTDPADPDTDDDDCTDGEETVRGIDPLNPDTDYDGKPDGHDKWPGWQPYPAGDSYWTPYDNYACYSY